MNKSVLQAKGWPEVALAGLANPSNNNRANAYGIRPCRAHETSKSQVAGVNSCSLHTRLYSRCSCHALGCAKPYLGQGPLKLEDGRFLHGLTHPRPNLVAVGIAQPQLKSG